MGEVLPPADANFDVKAWVNDVCSKKISNEPMDRYLAELEMRMHLRVEDLDASLEDDSARAFQRIPGAIQEVTHVQADVASLKADVDRVLRQLDAAASSAEQSVALLVQIDLAKSRMEEASSVLKEATELAELFQKVDGIFASGNLQKMASLLGTMHRSLSLVGNVPEFQGGMERLEALESRFQAIVEPQLSAALAEKKGDKVQQLAGYFTSIKQPASIINLYATARIASLQKIWESFDAAKGQGALGSWLPSFYEDLLSAIQVEAKWTASNLPDQYPDALLQLLENFFRRIDASFRSRLTNALSSESSHGALSILARLQLAADEFTQAVQQRLKSIPTQELLPILEANYAPFEAQVARYGELESRQLAAELEAVSVPTASADSVDSVMAGLKAAVNSAAALVEAAAERCSRCSQNTELQALMRVADQALTTFVERFEMVLREFAEDVLPSASPSGEETSTLLPLLHVSGGLQSRVGLLDAHLRGRAQELGQLLEVVDTGRDSCALTPVVLRLRRSQGELLQQLRTFVAVAEDASFSALPKATAKAAVFSDSVQRLIYNILMRKLKAELEGVPRLPSWHASEPESKFNLPSFSAYPQAYATAAGEYLMMLPQVLETLLSDPEAEDSEATAAVDADWLDKVAAGAADMYAEQLQKISSLSPQGSQQLAADLEYFCNVLSALGVAVPATLGTWQVAAQWSSEEFIQAGTQALEDGMVDKATLQNVALARGLHLM